MFLQTRHLSQDFNDAKETIMQRLEKSLLGSQNAGAKVLGEERMRKKVNKEEADAEERGE